MHSRACRASGGSTGSRARLTQRCSFFPYVRANGPFANRIRSLLRIHLDNMTPEELGAPPNALIRGKVARSRVYRALRYPAMILTIER